MMPLLGNGFVYLILPHGHLAPVHTLLGDGEFSSQLAEAFLNVIIEHILQTQLYICVSVYMCVKCVNVICGRTRKNYASHAIPARRSLPS